MDRKIRVAAIGDNCIDYYDSLNESYPGGNPVNVAVYIKRLGGESSYTGAVGTDSFGKIMISAIQNKGVDTSHIQVLDGKTAVTHVDIVDGDRVFGKYEEGVLADFKLREQDISFIKKHDLFELFTLLPEELQKDIIKCHPEKDITRDMFELNLKELGKAFTEFRYSYEKDSMAFSAQFLAELFAELYERTEPLKE